MSGIKIFKKDLLLTTMTLHPRYTLFGYVNRDAISVNADRDMELPKLTVTYDKEWGDNILNALFVAESTTFKRDYLMGSRTDPLSFEALFELFI